MLMMMVLLLWSGTRKKRCSLLLWMGSTRRPIRSIASSCRGVHSDFVFLWGSAASRLCYFGVGVWDSSSGSSSAVVACSASAAAAAVVSFPFLVFSAAAATVLLLRRNPTTNQRDIQEGHVVRCTSAHVLFPLYVLEFLRFGNLCELCRIEVCIVCVL